MVAMENAHVQRFSSLLLIRARCAFSPTSILRLSQAQGADPWFGSEAGFYDTLTAIDCHARASRTHPRNPDHN